MVPILESKSVVVGPEIAPLTSMLSVATTFPLRVIVISAGAYAAPKITPTPIIKNKIRKEVLITTKLQNHVIT